MALMEWVQGFFKKDGTTYLADCLVYDLQVEVYYKKLAIDSAINLIANALILSKFDTFEKGKNIRGNNYYLFNVRPNQNQNAASFFHELVTNLIYENEALVIMMDEHIYIADEWTKKEFAFKDNIYTDVVVSGLSLDRSFSEKEVFYFKHNNDRIVTVIDSLYASYGKLMAASMLAFKRDNSMKAIVEVDSSVPLTDDEQKAREDLFNEQFKAFFNAENGAVLPLSKGLTYKEVKQKAGVNANTSRDIRAIVDDIFDFVATATHVPKGLLKGDLAEVDGQVDNFLTFAVNPVVEILKDEINGKMYSKQEYLERTYLKINTMMIKYVDPTKLSTALDKFLSSGTTNVDENREMIGYEPINEDWSRDYYITKNYQRAEDFLNESASKGGESE